MPKMKSHRGLAKRVKQTGSGKLKRSYTYTSHCFHGRTQKQKRHLGKSGTVHNTGYERIEEVLVK